MCRDLSFNCEIVGVETVRESSGLALSSRNKRLTDTGRLNATVIFKGLSQIKEGIEKKQSISSLLEEVRNLYAQDENFDLEYLEAVDPKNMSKANDYDSLDELAVCVAGYVEGVRLIDNLYLRLK